MKILLATDGSSFSESAAQAVTAMLLPHGTEVMVLEVVEPLLFTAPPQMAPGYAPEQAERLKELVQEAKKTTDRTAEVLRKAGFKTETRIVESEIRSGILDTAVEWKPDLIVLGSHGRKGIEKFLLGSIADAVARHAKCSVLIVRGAPAAAAGYRAA